MIIHETVVQGDGQQFHQFHLHGGIGSEFLTGIGNENLVCCKNAVAWKSERSVLSDCLPGCKRAGKKEEEYMKNEHDEWTCTACGYCSTSRFIGDICPRCGMTYWHCRVCGFTMPDVACPDVCPECHAKCKFTNITCYIPG